MKRQIMNNAFPREKNNQQSQAHIWHKYRKAMNRMLKSMLYSWPLNNIGLTYMDPQNTPFLEKIYSTVL